MVCLMPSRVDPPGAKWLSGARIAPDHLDRSQLEHQAVERRPRVRILDVSLQIDDGTQKAHRRTAHDQRRRVRAPVAQFNPRYASNMRTRAKLSLMYLAELRCGDTCAINADAIDWDVRAVTVPHVEWLTKTGGRRVA